MIATEQLSSDETASGERADLLATLALNRHFLRHTVQNLTDEQARLTPTASQLCLGGLIKHVTATEAEWTRFAQGLPSHDQETTDWAGEFRFGEDETLTGLLERYEEVARRTEELVATLDLNTSYPLPEAPWFEPGARWTVRRVLTHLIAETAQHSGHADIIRESLDGQKTMG
ncbi:DinB family protein [Umezawaea beigongshangensis]|uniref:DinB family protein n=1 Tax=Umezawaea beigongshangensis TaxID=2780383 RepID=UPI0018F1BF7D|nr:DinB family protein [Umezawaea beigongshangensis]